MIRGAILASGRGSNAANLVNFSRENGCNNRLNIVCLVTDNPESLVLERAEEWDLPCYCIPHKGIERVRHEEKILKTLQFHNVDWVFLAGYKRILSGHFLAGFIEPKEKYPRVVNIHPSLLPDLPGLNAYQRAFEAGQDFSGVTVHLVDEGVDTGPIICQERFPRKKDDTLEDFTQRGLALEHRLYRKAVQLIIDGKHNAH